MRRGLLWRMVGVRALVRIGARASGDRDGADGTGIRGFRLSHLCRWEEFSIARSAGDSIHLDLSIEPRFTADTSTTRLTRRMFTPGDRERTTLPVEATRTVFTPERERSVARSTP